MDAQSLTEIARSCVAKATDKGIALSTAESLTAGMVASAIADIPGASAVLRGGAVTYCDDIKHRVLGVGEQSLVEYTAVSAQVAEEMALGSRLLFESDIAVSLTGYAGPDGGEDGTPAGTVYIGVATSSGVRSVRCQFEGPRNVVRRLAAARALMCISQEVDAADVHPICAD